MNLPLSPFTRSTELLSEWAWLVPRHLSPFMVTPFGDLFLKGTDGTVYFLDTLWGQLVDAADDESDLFSQLQDEQLSAETLRPDLLLELAKQLGPLKEGSCFSAKIPLSLSGELVPSNFSITTLEEHLRSMGSLQRQVANDPPGTRYKPQVADT